MADAKNHDKNPDMRPGGRGGFIRNGGTNKGGTGRPRNEIKALMADVGNLAWDILRKRLQDPEELEKISSKDLASIADAPTKYLVPKKAEDDGVTRVKIIR